jgi:acetyltransferase-like isoleucine patch superfamily enzyme
MNIANARDAFEILSDKEAMFMAKDSQLRLYRAAFASFFIRLRTDANILIGNGVRVTHPEVIVTRDKGWLKVGLHDFGLTSQDDRTLINLRPTSRMIVQGRLKIGRGCRIVVSDNATLNIGDGTYITGLSNIICTKRIDIGEHTAISWGVQFLDSDFHSINGKEPINTGISIGSHVLIGSNVTILKNVTIGDGCVIGANSVVRESVPAGTMVMGNPAKVVREAVTWL